MVRAADLLPPDLLQSGEHRVLDEVKVDGDFFAFEIEAADGVYRVTSIGMLEIRVREIKTLAQAVSQFRRQKRQVAVQQRRQLTGDDPTRGLGDAPAVYAAEQVQIGGNSVASILTSPLNSASQAGNQLAEKAERTADQLTRRPGSRTVTTHGPLHQRGQPQPHRRCTQAKRSKPARAGCLLFKPAGAGVLGRGGDRSVGG